MTLGYDRDRDMLAFNHRGSFQQQLSERRKTMATFCTLLSKKAGKSLFAALTLTLLLTPTYALSAERDGAVLFFSWEDPKQELAHLSLPSLSQLSPRFAWREQHEAAEQEGPVERNYHWGNGLGVDGYAYPGARRPLWGY